ncbi:hypothetical protein A2715_00090 [Candidatus Woesebacteria bacterium RIFCSPHIGHO2_01_FULL_39_32]|uniref:8-oxo-dGTP diphosphatase n=1 Tax=Candidatus Woesebacteria bacterium RIFCSPLOWO2_01_FULL_39_25 TaxID=1802521 RepID=A0A1F8BNG8_9BACT|nr:MAG: damage repair protein MutT protein [Parcubacteria group bacterium GW2011_GWA1_38_7]OGM05634.1 MAG: hypothetical protein A2124_01185 [Candidatus Woesebacteria bacterium GWB1_37_5]OGM24965.1 MAG: hypothetical protein A2715_00090 [Candidatus Woesebacteria bacterium RIFCSPHIGHO2_01_FULL_39_32]OGM35476.1 MAG: hypothetical protein A3F01_02330 [Candidatus Woesebacteria bacterium RIFCSPHIGHO2_12_FULL_38_11]OGM65593.1 MAG: hypothetical protein A2893_01550 [Candidatus Woesebacteria bacterium RIFC
MADKSIVQKVVLAAIVFNKEEKVLVLQRNTDEEVFPNMWELPSGKREPLEDSLQSLKREVLEETNIDIDVILAFSTFDYQIEKPTEIRDTTQINFLTKAKGENIKISGEHQNFTWISEEDVKNYNFSEQTKKVIIDAFSFYEKLK